jgi:hypothetical protein
MLKKTKKLRRYSDYSLNALSDNCNIDNTKRALNLCNQLIQPSEFLQEALKRNNTLPINSEKARSELIVTPILVEWMQNNPNKLQYFSGNTFDVLPEKALKGRCDFLFTKHFSLHIAAPVIAMFEAKDDNVDNWYGQCGAEMYAAKLFNEQKNEPYKIIYGAVTDGYEWVFLRLEENMLLIDIERYYMQDLPRLLGALQTIADFYDKPQV